MLIHRFDESHLRNDLVQRVLKRIPRRITEHDASFTSKKAE